MSELEQNLQKIKAEKASKIIPDNIRAGVQIFDVVGTVEVMDSTDATATASDILSGETAYIKGGKVTGTMTNVGAKTVTPSINSTSTTTVNGYVTSISTPSVKSVIEANSKTNMLGYKAVGGAKATSITASVVSQTGCKVYALVVARGTLSTPDRWEMTHSWTVAPYGDEMWYQTMYIYEVLADGETTSFTVTQNVEEILYVTLISFDTSETLDLIYEQNSTATQSSSVNIQGSYQAGDFMFLTYLRSDEEDTDYSDDVLIKRTNSPYAEIPTTKYLTEDGHPPLLTAMRISEAASAKYSNLVFSTPNECAFCIFRIPSTALRPENIRANIKIMDIVGTLVENPESDIKEFLTTDEMYASTGNKEGDYAIIIDENNEFIGLYLYTNAAWDKQTVNTDDATAAATDMASGKTAYVKGQKITGTVPVITGTQNDYIPSGSIGKYGSYIYGYAKPAGRDNAQTTMYRAASTLNVRLPQADVAAVSGITADVIKKNVTVLGVTGDFEGTVTTDATATSGDIMEGKTAYVNGQKIVGTVAPITNINAGVATGAYVPSDKLTTLTLNTTITERGILGQNLAYQVSATGDQVTKAIGLSPAILKKGINILGMEGTFDSNPEAYNAKFETSGRTQGLTPLTMLVAVDKIDTSAVTNAANIFNGCTYLKSLPPMDLNNATSMQNMCRSCTNLLSTPEISIPLVTDGSYAFMSCSNLSSVSLTNTDKLSATTWMFAHCRNLATMPSLNYQPMTSVSYMFYNSGLLNKIDLSVFNRTKTNQILYFQNTFQECYSITEVNGYNINCNRSYVNSMFQNCHNLTTISNCNFGNVLNSYYMFWNCENLIGFDNCEFSTRYFNYYTYSNLVGTFYNCQNLVNIPNGMWNNLTAGGWSSMFWNCKNLIFPESMTINITNQYYGGLQSMFKSCEQLNTFNLYVRNGDGWGYGMNCHNMFDSCINLKSLVLNGFNINYCNYIFNNCPNLTSIVFENFRGKYSYNQFYANGMFSGTGIHSVNNISGMNFQWMSHAMNLFRNCWNLADIGTGVLNMTNAADLSYFFANCNNLSNIPYSEVNINKATSVTGMFMGCANLVKLNDWTFPNVTAATSLFSGCSNLTTLENISFPKLIEASSMFANCSSLKQFSDWNLPTVNNSPAFFSNCTSLETVTNLNMTTTKTVYNMFRECTSLNKVSNINFPSATSASNMFYNCTNLAEVSNINMQNLTSSAYMFYGAGNISNFTNLYLPKVTNASYMFMNSGNIHGLETLSMPNATNLYGMFQNSRAEVISEMNFPNSTTMYYMFFNCQNLKTVGNIHCPKVTQFHYMFFNCQNLETVGAIDADAGNAYMNVAFWMPNTEIKYNKLQNFGGFINIGKGYTYKGQNYGYYTINLLTMPNLSQTSMQNIMSNLYNLCTTYNVSSAGALSYKQNIMVYDTQYNLLTTDEITAVKNKGWLFNITNIT